MILSVFIEKVDDGRLLNACVMVTVT